MAPLNDSARTIWMDLAQEISYDVLRRQSSIPDAVWNANPSIGSPGKNESGVTADGGIKLPQSIQMADRVLRHGFPPPIHLGITRLRADAADASQLFSDCGDQCLILSLKNVFSPNTTDITARQ